MPTGDLDTADHDLPIITMSFAGKFQLATSSPLA